jgi:hypothetical protein
MPKSVEKEKSPQNQIWFRLFLPFSTVQRRLARRRRLTKTAMHALSILARFFPRIQTSKSLATPAFSMPF